MEFTAAIPAITLGLVVFYALVVLVMAWGLWRLAPSTPVPDEALPWLAGWLGLTLEGTWTAAQNRRLLRALMALRTTWGTAAGLRAWVRVYIAAFAGIDEGVLEDAGVPGIVESFVERRRLRLNGEWIYVRESPVGYTAYPMPVGANGPLFHINLEMNF